MGSAPTPRTRVLLDTCRALLAMRDEASITGLAAQVVRRMSGLGEEELLAYLGFLNDELAPDPDVVREAVSAAGERFTPDSAQALHRATRSRRLELFERVNVAHGATAGLIDLRGRVLDLIGDHPELEPVADDLDSLLRSWFNRGFLSLERIGWHTPASVLEKLIEYEAVHEITSWADMRRRLDRDRRCFGFFHPTLPGEPVIFVQVALTDAVPTSIQDLLEAPSPGDEDLDPRTATFYSISNCQEGLRGISFGSFLLKRVTTELRAELPGLERFVTLSPLPLFRSWLVDEGIDPEAMSDHDLLRAAARYLVEAKRGQEALDPVARFHLRNGARVEQLNAGADTSEQGLEQSVGVMVNYRYDESSLADDHEAYVNEGRIAVSPAIEALLG